MITHRSHNL
uniref:Uncharacterized protein n=1 Tax=Gerbera hybrida TaxID=18101 RepID=Q6EUV8_GERHY|nr:hypothetical protein [Gerbera hybrid cultivar]